LGVKVVAKAKGGGERMRENGQINRDGVDGELKLRFPSMMTFKMNAFNSDNKIKIRII
jgi:hypothetical protein